MKRARGHRKLGKKCCQLGGNMGTTRVCGLPCASASARDSTPPWPPQLTSVHLSEPGMCRSLLPLQGSTACLFLNVPVSSQPGHWVVCSEWLWVRFPCSKPRSLKSSQTWHLVGPHITPGQGGIEGIKRGAGPSPEGVHIQS